MEADSLLAYRGRFPVLSTSCYLINNSLGAMPAEVPDHLSRYTDLWNRRGVRAWAEEWWDLSSVLGDLVAPLLGTPAGSVSMQPNVTLATAVFLSCLSPSRTRSKIVTTDLQFPSVLYALEGWCRQHGVDVDTVSSTGERGRPSLGVEPEALLDAIDERTLAVVISHVEFKTAFINDAQAIAQRCRRTGALLLLDVFQSAGIVPLELSEWGVDAATGGCLKWLCGGPGNAFLYVDPDLAQTLEPRLTGWMAHPAPFAFEPPPMRLQSGSQRFLHGTPPIAPLYAARPGLEILQEVGVETIRRRSIALTDSILTEATDREWPVASPRAAERRAGTVTVEVPSAEQVAQELLARDVVIDYRPGAGIRIAPHFYNTVEECLHCFEQIDAILCDESWKRHPSVQGATPT